MIHLIIDTDFQMDVDDAGALAVAHALADDGVVSIRAVMLNTPSRWGAPALDIVNRACGRRLPIGTLPHSDESVPEPEYARSVVERFGEEPGAPVEDAVGLYRRLLSEAEPGSLTIVSIGFFDNLIALLDSAPDAHSSLSGADLVRSAVGRTLVMGGVFPEGREFNFVGDVALTRRLLMEWPLPIEFVGFETAAGMITGADLTRDRGSDDPVAHAYAVYNRGESGRDSWDPLTVFVAAHPGRFGWSHSGSVTIEQDGVNRFSADSEGSHRTLILPDADGAGVAAEIDGLLRRPNGSARVRYRDAS